MIQATKLRSSDQTPNRIRYFSLLSIQPGSVAYPAASSKVTSVIFLGHKCSQGTKLTNTSILLGGLRKNGALALLSHMFS